MNFNYDSIPYGFYDRIFEGKNGTRKFWHWHKFDSVVRTIDFTDVNTLLDIGCFSGSFAGRFLSEDINSVSVDILESQIQYAREHFETPSKKFLYYHDFTELPEAIHQSKFDVVTFIEVIEHLHQKDIKAFFDAVTNVTNKGSQVIITTPNYISPWPLLEIMLNHMSDVKYEEQHITKFNFWNLIPKLRKIYPDFDKNFEVSLITSSHLVTPFIATFNYELAANLSKKVSPSSWMNPFGSILILKLRRK